MAQERGGRLSFASGSRCVLLVVGALLFSALQSAAQLVPFGAPSRLDSGSFGISDRSFIRDAQVLAHPDGGFLAIWRALDEDVIVAVARRFDRGGGAIGEEMPLQAPFNSDWVVGPTGEILAAADRLYRFDAQGRPLGSPVVFDDVEAPPGEERSLGVPLNFARPALAVSPAGVVLVVWSVGFLDVDAEVAFARLFYRRFDSAGESLEEPVVIVVDASFGSVDVAAEPSGAFQIAYTRASSDPASADLRFQVIDPEGTGALPLPDPGNIGAVESPVVAVDGDGSAFIAFDSLGGQTRDGIDGDCSGVFAATASGRRRLHDDPADCQFNVRAAGLPTGGFVAAWETGVDERPALNPFHGIRVRRFAASGAPRGDALWVYFRDLRLDDLAYAEGRAVVVGVVDGAVFAQLFEEVPAGACTPGVSHLCLDGPAGVRFRADVVFRNPHGSTGRGEGRPFALTRDSGAFWFFTPDNPEVVVKVLDARSVNGRLWVLAGALTDTEWWLTVTDTRSRQQRSYRAPPIEVTSLADADAFPRPPPPPSPVPPAQMLESEAGEELVLLDRFQLTVSWRDPRSGDRGVGRAVPVNRRSGAFWFFDPGNVELMVKVVDGRALNGHFWIFQAGLTDVELELEVLDRATGELVRYFNAPFELRSRADTEAFGGP